MPGSARTATVVRATLHCRDVAGKVAESVKGVASSIIPAKGPDSGSSPAQRGERRHVQVVREEPPDMQLSNAIRGGRG